MLANYLKSGALGARAKCMYGRRLTSEQYDILLSKHSVGDLIRYLKAETHYGAAFSGVHEDMLHFGQIETLIRRDMYREYLRLCALAFGRDRKLMDAVLLHTEMKELLEFVMLLLSGRQGEYFCGLPRILRSRTSIDFNALPSCMDYAGLLDKLRGTHFYPVLSGFGALPAYDYTQLEVALTLDYFRQVLKIVGNLPDRRARAAMHKRLRNQAEILNIARIVRMKKHYGYAAEDILNNLVRIGKSPDTPLVRALVEADAGKLDGILENSRYGALAANMDKLGSERIYYALMHRNGIRAMYGPAPTPEIVFAYLDLKEIEMRNVITIVEGIRHSIPPSTTREYLIV